MTGAPCTYCDRTSGGPSSPQVTVTWNMHLGHARAAQLALLLLGWRPEGDQSASGRHELNPVGSELRYCTAGRGLFAGALRRAAEGGITGIEGQVRACRKFAEPRG